MRCVTHGIADTKAFFEEVYDLLRPGGILLFVEGDFMHGEDCKILTQEDQNAPVGSMPPTLELPDFSQ